MTRPAGSFGATTRPVGSFVGADRPANPAADHLYFRNFADDAVAAGLPSDFSERCWEGSARGDFDIFLDSGRGENVLRDQETTFGDYAVSWDTPGVIDGDVEVVVLIREPDNGQVWFYDAPALRIEGGGGADSVGKFVFSASTTGPKLNVGHWKDGAPGGYGTPVDYSADRTLWRWFRLQIIGSTIRARTWPEGSEEPGTWLREETPASLLVSPGYVGIPGLQANKVRYIARLGVSTDPTEDPAPMTADEAGADAFTATTRPTGSFAGAS